MRERPASESETTFRVRLRTRQKAEHEPPLVSWASTAAPLLHGSLIASVLTRRIRALATVDLCVVGSSLGCTVGESLGPGSIS